MAIADLPLFQALRTKMRWHQARQGVLAENVANADTPGYRARDLKQLNFERTLRTTSRAVAAARTHPAHLPAGVAARGSVYGTQKTEQFEITPNGNGVTLEEQMMNVTANQMDYQAATTLYSRGLGLIRTAVKRG